MSHYSLITAIEIIAPSVIHNTYSLICDEQTFVVKYFGKLRIKTNFSA